MAQINLLSGESTSHQLPWQQVSNILVKVLSGLVILLLAAWGFLYFANKSTTNEIYKTQNEIKVASENLVSLPERKEVITRQGQLKAYNSALGIQTHWSTFLATKLAPITLKISRYVSMNATSDGKIRLTVSVPGYADLDKFLQVFDSSEFNKVFTDIKVTSLAKSQSGDKLDIRFDVTMKYNPVVAKETE